MEQKCTVCGTIIEEGSEACPKCGTLPGEYKDLSHTPAYAAPAYDAPPPKSSRYSPLGAGEFLWSIVLFCIPAVGLIFCIIWACGGCRSKTRINFARGALMYLCLTLLIAILAVSVLSLTGYLPQIKEMFLSLFA